MGQNAAVSFRLADGKTLSCTFGWVFTVDMDGDAVSEQNGPSPPQLVLVDSVSGQVVATSRPYTPETFGRVFEVLLARSRANGRNWCLTMSAHVGDRVEDIAEDARRAGLYLLKAGRKLGSI